MSPLAQPHHMLTDGLERRNCGGMTLQRNGNRIHCTISIPRRSSDVCTIPWRCMWPLLLSKQTLMDRPGNGSAILPQTARESGGSRLLRDAPTTGTRASPDHQFFKRIHSTASHRSMLACLEEKELGAAVFSRGILRHSNARARASGAGSGTLEVNWG